MTMVTISDQDPRSLKAVEIAAGAGQWLKCRLTDGRKAYGIPSQCTEGRYYLVDTTACTCEDFKRHGLTPARIGQAGDHAVCKHILAVRLQLALIKAHQETPRRKSTPRPQFAVSHTTSRGEIVHLPVRQAAAQTASTADDDARVRELFERL